MRSMGKHHVHGHGVADKAWGHPGGMPSRCQTHCPPGFLGRSGARSRFPGSRYLSSCSQHLGGGINSRGWSLGLRRLGKDWQEARDGEAGA